MPRSVFIEPRQTWRLHHRTWRQGTAREKDPLKLSSKSEEESEQEKSEEEESEEKSGSESDEDSGEVDDEE